MSAEPLTFELALQILREDRIARLDEELCGEGLVAFCGASRYEEAA